jgi:hypothetical protein
VKSPYSCSSAYWIRVRAARKAGDLLIQMRERGERVSGGDALAFRQDRTTSLGGSRKPTLADLRNGEPELGEPRYCQGAKRLGYRDQF